MGHARFGALRPDAVRMISEVPSCTTPATSSSAVRGDGMLVEARIDDGQIVVELSEGIEPGWPEKCFGERPAT
jgi:hypothetical protein